MKTVRNIAPTIDELTSFGATPQNNIPQGQFTVKHFRALYSQLKSINTFPGLY
jgi:hypothetical protein